MKEKTTEPIKEKTREPIKEKTTELIKDYPQRFENVFYKGKGHEKFEVGRVSFVNPTLDTKKFLDYYAQIIDEMTDYWWKFSVKMRWLSDNYRYNNFERFDISSNNHLSDMTFSFFLRDHGRRDFRLYTRSHIYSKLNSYFKDFFEVSDFKLNNPFEDFSYYQYPYKNIGVSFLFTVYQMPERLQLLQRADDRNMSYNEFLDYLINYLSCFNEDLGKIKYEFVLSKLCPPYVRAYKSDMGKNKKYLYE